MTTLSSSAATPESTVPAVTSKLALRALHAVDEVVIFFPIIERDNIGTLTISGLRKASHVAFMSSCMHEI